MIRASGAIAVAVAAAGAEVWGAACVQQAAGSWFCWSKMGIYVLEKI